MFAVKLVVKLLTPDPQVALERPGLVYRRDAVRELASSVSDSGDDAVAGDPGAADPRPPDPKR